MRRNTVLSSLALLALSGLLAACVATAVAGDTWDVIHLKAGSSMTGHILEVRNGSYWMEMADGSVMEIPLGDVLRVDRAVPAASLTAPGASAANPAAPGAAPPTPATTARPDKESGVGGGFDLGWLAFGGRLRLYNPKGAVHHVDLRLGAGMAFAFSSIASLDGIGPTLTTGAEVGFLRGPVHLDVGMLAGIWLSSFSSPYPAIGITTGVEIDPKGPFSVHLGLQNFVAFSSFGSFDLGYFLIAPDMSVGWVW